MEINNVYDTDKLIGYIEYLERDRDNNRERIILVRQRIETILSTKWEPNEFDKRIESIDSIEPLLSEIKEIDEEHSELLRKRKVLYKRMKQLVKNSTIWWIIDLYSKN